MEFAKTPADDPRAASSLRVAVYPGSFDPITLGHLEIAARAATLFDRVIIAVGHHPSKPGTFGVDERCALIEASVGEVFGAGGAAIEVAAFEGLVVEFCRQRRAQALVRGLRAIGDFEPEFRMALANRDLAPEIETIFLIPRPENMYVSSSLVREIAAHGGDFARYVPGAVAQAMRSRRLGEGSGT